VDETGKGRGRRRTRTRRWQLFAAALAVVVLAAACEAAPGDFTGDRKADVVYRSGSDWYLAGQATPIWTEPSATPPDVAIDVAADYDGDLKWDPAAVVGTTWYSTAFSTPVVFDPPGMPVGPPALPAGAKSPPVTLIPVPGDYDGTGKAVPAYYDQVDGTWWIMGHDGSVQFGNPPTAGGTLGYDVPMPADYDGDHKTDIAVYDPSTATFHYLSSKTGQEVSVQIGQPGDFPVPADYDKVGYAEPAVTDWNVATWCVAGHTGAFATLPRPSSADYYAPIEADYDGNGTADPAVYDPPAGTWQVAGQGTIATTPSYVVPAEAQPWLYINMVRLTLFQEQLVATVGQPKSCAS
jgi:hypothetical protein